MTDKEMMDKLKEAMTILKAQEKLFELKNKVTAICFDLDICPSNINESFGYPLRTAEKAKHENDLIKFMRNRPFKKEPYAHE